METCPLSDAHNSNVVVIIQAYGLYSIFMFGNKAQTKEIQMAKNSNKASTKLAMPVVSVDQTPVPYAHVRTTLTVIKKKVKTHQAFNIGPIEGHEAVVNVRVIRAHANRDDRDEVLSGWTDKDAPSDPIPYRKTKKEVVAAPRPKSQRELALEDFYSSN